MGGYFLGVWLRETFGTAVLVPLFGAVLISGLWAFASWARRSR
jgi:hypothetical protein